MFDTKIAIVVRDDLATWQKLNVTAFLTSGIVGASPDIIGEAYRDAENNTYHSLCAQPIIVLSADGEALKAIHRRALERKVPHGLYIEEMFTTGMTPQTGQCLPGMGRTARKSSASRCARRERSSTRSPRARGCIPKPGAEVRVSSSGPRIQQHLSCA